MSAIPKYLVIPIAVTKPLQKILLQVRHPENAEAITGIDVSLNFNQGACVSNALSLAQLSIAIPQKGDVIYNELLKINVNDFREQGEKIINNYFPFSSTTFSINGKKSSYFETYHPVEQALAEVYLESYYNPPVSADPENPNVTAFEVKLYIRYKLKTPKHDC